MAAGLRPDPLGELGELERSPRPPSRERGGLKGGEGKGKAGEGKGKGEGRGRPPTYFAVIRPLGVGKGGCISMSVVAGVCDVDGP